MNDIITDVQEEKKGALVTVNHSERFWLGRRLWRERPMEIGEELDLDELKAWLLPRQYPAALNDAVSLLAARARSRGEIEQRLRRRRYTEDTIEMVLYKLETENLLDDEQFARDWAASRSRNQVGSRRIAQELRLKGVDSEVAAQALDAVDEDESAEQAIQLALKCFHRYRNEEPFKATQKVLAAMARRGYDYDDAHTAMQAALEQMKEETD